MLLIGFSHSITTAPGHVYEVFARHSYVDTACLALITQSIAVIGGLMQHQLQ
jgi:hypothetical protein